jgi:hypothetical protein
MKKTLIAIVIMLTVFGVASPALASGTPSWWVPGNDPKTAPPGYASWNHGWASGSVVNAEGSQIIYVSVVLQVDNTYNVDNRKLVWAQAEWTPTGPNAAQTFPVTPIITYSNDPCPANVATPFVNPIGPFFMRNQGAGIPDPAHKNPASNPPDQPYASMSEYSFGYNSTPPELNPPGINPQPACERVEFKFQVGVQSQADWRVEVQTVCLTPTAITLRSLEAENVVASLPMLGLVGVPLITVSLLGGNTLLRRKHAARERRP